MGEGNISGMEFGECAPHYFISFSSSFYFFLFFISQNLKFKTTNTYERSDFLFSECVCALSSYLIVICASLCFYIIGGVIVELIEITSIIIHIIIVNFFCICVF